MTDCEDQAETHKREDEGEEAVEDGLESGSLGSAGNVPVRDGRKIPSGSNEQEDVRDKEEYASLAHGLVDLTAIHGSPKLTARCPAFLRDSTIT
jgi:hypothetical protein